MKEWTVKEMKVLNLVMEELQKLESEGGGSILIIVDVDGEIKSIEITRVMKL